MLEVDDEIRVGPELIFISSSTSSLDSILDPDRRFAHRSTAPRTVGDRTNGTDEHEGSRRESWNSCLPPGRCR